MNNKSAITLTVMLASLISACATPAQTAPAPKSGKAALERQNRSSNHSPSSTTAIQSQEEKRYAQLLQEVKAKNAYQDAQRAIASGNPHILGYQSGRGGFKTPGVKIAKPRCSTKQLTGMGDMVFGENHLNYRIALKNYAKQFNQLMLPYCR